MGHPSYKFEAFVSHAVEDKISIATELCDRLKKSGCNIWYSSSQFLPGDDIEKAIYKGLEESRFGIVIFSADYLSKRWTIRELELMRYLETKEDREIILPVLHGITLDEVISKYPFLASRWSISSEKELEFVLEAIVKKIKPQRTVKPPRWRQLAIGFLGALALTLLGYLAYTAIIDKDDAMSLNLIESSIGERIADFQEKVDKQYLANLKRQGAELCTLEKIDTLFTRYKNLDSYFRNEYEFSNGFTTIRSKKNVQQALGVDVASLEPYNSYQLQSPHIYFVGTGAEPQDHVKYAFVNAQPVRYKTGEMVAVNDSTYTIDVTYENNVRYIYVDLTFAKTAKDTKRHKMMLIGFLPAERYWFNNKKGIWVLTQVQAGK